MRVHLKVRFAPFFTTKRSASSPSRRSTRTYRGDRARPAAALEDDRPIRLLGVRAEMVPPEGGYS